MVSTSFPIPLNVTNLYDIYFNARLTENGEYLYAGHNVSFYRTNLNTMITVDIPTSQSAVSGSSFDINIEATAQVAKLAYMVLARGVVVDSGPIYMTGLSKTHTIPATRWMSPQAYVVVYGIVTDGKMSEVIADSVDVKGVKGVFDNEVSLEFSAERSRAGTPVDVTVRTAPNSKYYILAVDKSVLLLGTGNDLSKADVTNKIENFALGKTPSYTEGPEPHFGVADAIMPGPFPGGGRNDVPTSAGEIFTERGLVIMAEMIVEDKPQRPNFPIREAVPGAPAPPVAAAGQPSGAAVAEAVPENTQYAAVGQVRKFFPEAWLWLDGMVNFEGFRTFTQTVPDTITKWQATAFAISDTKGLAITEHSAKMTSFQPFFTSLTLPYAIVRGEIFQLRVTINNYIEPAQDTSVRVTLKQSDDFGVYEMVDGQKSVVSKDVVEEIQVKANIPGLVIFEISAKKLGLIKLSVVAQPEQSTGEKGDSLMRTVLVKPEGRVQREVEGTTVELDDENIAFSRNIPISFPEDVVEGSRRVEVKVTGDVMGPTVDGLERLIRMPTGCGEKNMITLVPNIVVYSYLKTVNRLTTDIEDRAIANMKDGYQRELQYLRTDGSFSAFGNRDKNGSTWLTAFVMKSFSQARNEITVDPKMMKRAFTFLINSQQADRTFKLIGNVIHKEMLAFDGHTAKIAMETGPIGPVSNVIFAGGSVAGNHALTAFIFIALKESETFLSATTRTYLEDLVRGDQLTSTYEMAIVAYALTLADSSLATELLNKLGNREKPWDRPRQDEPVPVEGQGGPMIMPRYPPKATSSDVETWSFFLLAYAERKDIVMGRPIMKWLLSQQNGQGGFLSTQDTVLGLQALAEYAAMVYEAPQTDITLRMRSNKDSHEFKVENEQLLLLQSYVFQFPDDTTFVELNAIGRGLALVKVVWQYNTMRNKQKKTPEKEIRSKVVTEKINDELHRIICCFKSEHRNLGMTTMSLQLQTEMSVVNRQELEQDRNMKRVDIKDGYVHMYFDEPTPEFQCANISVHNDAPVINRQCASLKTVVYYQSEIDEELLYTVAETDDVMEICATCTGSACPDECDKCINCACNCPAECEPVTNICDSCSGDECPDHCDKCKNCGTNCPEECEPMTDICDSCSGDECPGHCDKCKNCGTNCPEECEPVTDICDNCSGNECPDKCSSGASIWKFDRMLLSLVICFFLSLIMAM